MYPRSRLEAKKYRERKRKIEIEVILDHIQHFGSDQPCGQLEGMLILEFGSGHGFQISHLKRLGHVIGSDISVREEIKDQVRGFDFVVCDITHAPFKDARFNLVFSNHVLEHIESLDMVLQECKRVGKPDCLYAFTVPTCVWLLLSLPAQYYNKAREIGKMARLRRSPKGKDGGMEGEKPGECCGRRLRIFFDRFMPRGHGAKAGFWACYRAFRVTSWKQVFEENGFAVRRVKPTLLYAPSEWPIVPLRRAPKRFNLFSSVLFLLNKKAVC
jgi:SAM-dependent methyltransferase